MHEGTKQRVQMPAIAGLVGNISSLGLTQYWLASKAYFLPTTSGLILTAAILLGLASIACWALALKHLADGRGQSTWFATLAPLGPLGLGILYLTDDNHTKKKHYARRQPSHASATR